MNQTRMTVLLHDKLHSDLAVLDLRSDVTDPGIAIEVDGARMLCGGATWETVIARTEAARKVASPPARRGRA